MSRQVNIQSGHIARHTPTNIGAQGREAAIVDVAQDLLLSELAYEGALDTLVFKGGTALRKMWAGAAGRFSLDLDFSYATIDANPDDMLMDLIAAIDGRTIGPFTYGVAERRGKWMITYQHPFGGQATLSSKLDLSPPSWLPPIRRGWVPLDVHMQYGDPPLPELSIVQLEENVAEKIARLNRATIARDMYDLRWVMTTPSVVAQLDKPLIRRLAVLKIWVDANGLHAGNTYWKPGHEGPAFDTATWLRDRSRDIDIDDIGALSVPVPTAAELSDAVRTHYSFLADLEPDEDSVAGAREADRALVIRLLSDLPGSRLRRASLY